MLTQPTLSLTVWVLIGASSKCSISLVAQPCSRLSYISTPPCPAHLAQQQSDFAAWQMKGYFPGVQSPTSAQLVGHLWEPALNSPAPSLVAQHLHAASLYIYLAQPSSQHSKMAGRGQPYPQ